MARKAARTADREVRRGDGFIQERVRSDGTTAFQARWPEEINGGGTRFRSRTFATRVEAEDHLTDVGRQRRRGIYRPVATITVADLLTEWLARGRHDWAAQTYTNYRGVIENHLVPVLGTVRAVELTTLRVQRWIDGLDMTSTAPGTARLWILVLSMAMKEASRLGIVAGNPCDYVRRPRPRRTEVETWTVDDIQRFMASSAVASDPMWIAVYTLELTTGLRPGELTALGWPDVDLEAGTARIRRTMTRGDDGRHVLGDRTKTGRSRTVVLSAAAAAALRTWRSEQRVRRLAAPSWPCPEMVFTRPNGTLMIEPWWRYNHDRLLALAGVKRITLHQLRHTNATLDIDQNPKLVSERLGHSSIAITLGMYTHPSAQDHRAASEGLSRRLFGSPLTEPNATTSIEDNPETA